MLPLTVLPIYVLPHDARSNLMDKMFDAMNVRHNHNDIVTNGIDHMTYCWGTHHTSPTIEMYFFLNTMD